MSGTAPERAGEGNGPWDGFDPEARRRRNPAARGAALVDLAHFLSDALALALAYALALAIRFGIEPADFDRKLGGYGAYAATYLDHAGWYWLVLGVPLLALYAVHGLYEGHRRLHHTPLLWNLIVSNVAVLLLVAASMFFRKNTWHMRGFLPLVLLLDIPCAWTLRRLVNAVIARFRARGRLLTRVVLVGEGDEARALLRLAEEGALKGNRIVRRIPSPRSPAEARAAVEAAATPEIAALFVADPAIPDETLHALLAAAVRRNLSLVVYYPAFLALHNPFAYGDLLRGHPLVHFAHAGASFPASRFRVFVSSALAGAALVLLSPLFLAIALAIRLDSPGPAIFAQERYGLGWRRFRMFKFRTMVADAESKLDALRGRNESDGALFKLRDDPRVTRVGRFLRRTSLDELPQLVNILRGEMRFVGPRPLPCEDLEPYLHTWHGLRQLVRPGLTCIWQCAGRSDIGFEGMSLLDGWYVLNRNWMLDIRILARTAWTVVFRHGAY